MHSLSPEGMYEQAEQAYNDGDLARLLAIEEDFRHTYDMIEYEKLSRKIYSLYCDLKKQKARDFIAQNWQGIVQSESDGFSVDTEWSYSGLEHPNDSTLVSLYYKGRPDLDFEDLHLKISCNVNGDNRFSDICFSNDSKKLYGLSSHINYDTENKNLVTWGKYTVFDMYLGRHNIDERFSVKYDEELDIVRNPIFPSILSYFYKSLTQGNGLKIRLFGFNKIEIITRDLSEAEIAGLRYILAAQLETANYIRGLLGLDPLQTM